MLCPPSERPAASRFPKPRATFLGSCPRREPAMHPTAPVPRRVSPGIPHGRSAARRTRAASRTAPRPLRFRYPTRGRGFLVEGESQPSPKARQHGPTVQPNSGHPKMRTRFRAGVSQRFASPSYRPELVTNRPESRRSLRWPPHHACTRTRDRTKPHPKSRGDAVRLSAPRMARALRRGFRLASSPPDRAREPQRTGPRADNYTSVPFRSRSGFKNTEKTGKSPRLGGGISRVRRGNKPG